jgi:hypothetical protein
MASLPNVRAAHQSHAEPATITSLAAAQARFTERYREFLSKTRRYFDDRTPERRDDCTSRAIAFAWRMIVGELRHNRLTDVRMYSCLKFAWRQSRSNRTEYRGDGNSPRDLAARWRRGAYRDAKRRAPSPGGLKLNDPHAKALTEAPSDRTPVPEVVAFRLDTPRWLDSLTPEQRDRTIDLGMGYTTTECAKMWGVGLTAVSQYRAFLADSYLAFISR